MPLSPQGPDLSFFSTHFDTAAEAAESWADAIGEFIGDGLSVTAPAPGAVDAAQTVLQASLTVTFGTSTTVSDSFDDPMDVFAAAIALSMTPAFTGVAPVASFSSNVFSISEYDNAETAATTVALEILAWFATASATNSSSGATSIWT